MEEQLQTIVELNVAAMTAVAIYLTVVSGYLAVAYFIGRNLSVSQLVILSILFIAFAYYFSAGADNFFRASLSYSESVGRSFPESALMMFWIQIAGIVASLWFMIDRKMNKRNDT